MGNKKLIVYGIESSPPCQAVLLTLKALNLRYELRLVDLFNREQRSQEYLQKNPAQTIPTLEDNGIYIGDSHAIMPYLVGKYAKNDKLYPKDLVKRALVDQRLHFENSILFLNCVKQCFQPILAGARTDIPAEKFTAIANAYNMLEGFFGDYCYVAGKHMTIADFSCFTSVTCLQLIVPLSEEKHPKIHAWFERMRQLQIVEEVMCNDNVQAVQKFLSKKLSKL